MCGIAGHLSPRPPDQSVVKAMVERLRHRGPDSSGYYHTPRYSAGMCRLRINDLVTGDQPLFDETGSVVLFYNGEIYNSPELRRQLEAAGHRFSTHSDGEVICHLYAECGEALFEQLDGMFAAALWVPAEDKLILARDIPGEKPLYYASTAEGGLVFASEIKALRAVPGLQLELDAQALWDLPTFLWIPEPDTVYRGVRALPRGHLLVVDRTSTRLLPFRNLFNRQRIGDDDREVIAETRRVVTEAIRSRLLADVPVGSFLSSGLDSSIVATLASRDLGALDTFSVAFEDLADPYHGRADESVEAGRHAKRIGSRHHVVHATGDSFRADLDRFCRHGDQPFAVSSGLGILAVAKAAREAGVTVLLSGDGADECFGGYSWYLQLERLRLQTGSIEHGGGEPDLVSFQNFGDDLETRLRTIARYGAAGQAWAWHYYAHEREKHELFHPDWSQGVSSSLRHFSRFCARTTWDPEEFIAQDRDFYFPNEMLRKVDRMTMAWSVEGRVPFAAPAVLSHAAKLSFRHLVRDGTLKWALRRAFADLLPPEIVARPKHGFNVPIDHWLRTGWSDLVDESFGADSALRRLGIVRADSGERARAMLRDPRRLNGHTVFAFVMLNRWLELEHG